jgi:hypothetical protein
VTRDEQLELYALVVQAFELRGTPYLVDACTAIEQWHERRPLTALERRQAREAELADLVQLLRETEPTRLRRKAA